MEPPDRQGIDLKLERASNLLDHLQTEMNDLVSDYFEKVGGTSKDRQKAHIVTLPYLPSPPRGWPTVIGDIAHNQRCALDYIVYELSKSDPKVEEDKTAFPICTTEDAYGKRQESIQWLPTDAREVVDRLQPFNLEDAETSPLVLLQLISNTDKHRHIALVTQEITVRLAVRQGEPQVDPGGAGLWVYFAPPGPQPLLDRQVLKTLREIDDCVHEVVSEFERWFPSPDAGVR